MLSHTLPHKEDAMQMVRHELLAAYLQPLVHIARRRAEMVFIARLQLHEMLCHSESQLTQRSSGEPVGEPPRLSRRCIQRESVSMKAGIGPGALNGQQLAEQCAPARHDKGEVIYSLALENLSVIFPCECHWRVV